MSMNEQRGALRMWQDHDALIARGELEIRPGDIVLLDWEANGMPDHVIDKRHAYDRAHEADAEKRKRETGEAATGEALKPEGMLEGQAGGHVRIGVRVIGRELYGIGRPSLVDFEDHVYDHHPENQNKAPARPPA
jgi:hypothetical protein